MIMTFRLVTSFFDKNCSTADEADIIPSSSEFKIVSDILRKPEIKSQIAALLKELELKGRSIVKSEAKSDKHREEGNRLFRIDKKVNALAASRHYTKAILMAPENSQSLALAHANRAAALVEFGYYQEAYSDCELALQHGYPEDKQVKIIMRQAFCAVKLKNFADLEGIVEKLNTMKLAGECRRQREEFEKHMKMLAEFPARWHQDEPHDYKVQNICRHPKKGRYLTAWKDYRKDQVILSEKAYAFVPVNSAKICSNCAKEQFVPIPCYACSKVFYCSQFCKLVNEEIHQHECLAWKWDLLESVGIAHLAVNTLLRGLPEIIDDLLDLTSAQQIWERIEDITDKGGKGYGDILALFNNLHSHEPGLIRKSALAACLIGNYLVYGTKFSDLFNRTSLCGLSEWEIVISALIFRHTIQMAANAQSGMALVFAEKPYDYPALADIWVGPRRLKKRLLHTFRGIDVVYAGIFPYLSLCNHSCEPSLRLNFNGTRVIVKARKAINKGDEIFNSYTLDCRNISRDDRQEQLKSLYRFECDCKHCQPETEDEEFLKFHKHRCTNCKKLYPLIAEDLRWWLDIEEDHEVTVIKCPSCGTPLCLDWYFKFDEIFRAKEKLSCEGFMEAVKLFKHAEEIASEFSDLRQHMAWRIVSSFFEFWLEKEIDNEVLFNEISEIIKYWLDQLEKQSDFESMLYATTSAFALDLMAEGKHYDFDKRKMRKSFDGLSGEVRTVFDNYIKDYIGDKFDVK